MPRLGQAWVTIGTKDQDLRSGLSNAKSLVTREIASMQSTLKSLTIGLGTTAATAGIAAGFRAGIKAVDDYKLATIGVAATLTDMAKKGSGDLKAVYANNLAYAQDTYQRVELAAAKFFASGSEMVQAWQILTQKGTLITSDEDINNLGVIVDKIKLATQGQMSSLQIAQELRSVMNGQARATDQIAMYLKDKLGPEWEKQLKTAREQGDVLEWLSSQFEGLKYASGDVENTLESQLSTLQTLATQVGRNGLSGAYEDIVGVVREINVYIDKHRDILESGIVDSWEAIKSILTNAELRSFLSVTLGEGARQASDLGSALKVTLLTANDIMSLFNTLPDYVRGPAGIGIIGTMLFGGKYGALIAMFSAVNNGMNVLGAGFKNILADWEKFIESTQNIGDVISGKRNAQTGEWNLPPGSIRKPIPSTISTDSSGRTMIDITKSGWTKPGITTPTGLNDKKGKTHRQIGYADIDQTIASMSDRVASMRKGMVDAGKELDAMVAESSGRYLDAEMSRIDQWYNDITAKVYEDLSKQQTQFNELYEKVTNAKGGASAQALAGIAEAQTQLNDAWSVGLQTIKLYDAEKAQKVSDIQRNFQIDSANTIAQIKQSYADISGSVDDQVSAQVEYIKATEARNVADAKTPEIAEWYRKLADEQERIAKIKTGTFWQGFQNAAQQYEREIPTISDLGAQAFDQLESSVDSLSDSLAEFCATGKMNFSDFAQSMIKDIAKMIIKMELMRLAEGAIGLFSSGASLVVGGTSSSSSNGWAIVSHSGGLIGSTSFPRRSVSSGMFSGAPRLHSGLASDEFPAILQRGETVLSKNQSKSAQGSTTHVNIVNQVPGTKARQGMPRWDGKQYVRDIFLELAQSDESVRYQLGLR